MRATLDVRENRGIFSTGWTVECRIEFTELELAAIKHGKLGSKTLYTTDRDGIDMPTTLTDVIRNGGLISWRYKTVLAARKEHEMIEHQLLPMIKSWLDAVDGFGSGTKTIEL